MKKTRFLSNLTVCSLLLVTGAMIDCSDAAGGREGSGTGGNTGNTTGSSATATSGSTATTTTTGGSATTTTTGSSATTTTTGGSATTTTTTGSTATTTGGSATTTTTGSSASATTTTTGGSATTTTTTGSSATTTTTTGSTTTTTTTSGTTGTTTSNTTSGTTGRTTGSTGTTTSTTSGTTGTTTGGDAGAGCTNTNQSVINEDASGYVCNNTFGIKGAWYCYSDGADSSISCKGSDGKGAGAIPWNTTSSAMCLSGTMGTGTGSYAGIGFKVNSGPPGSTAAPGTWNASSLVGFAITLTSGSSGKGSGGMILNLESPTSTDLDPSTKDAPGITVPGVPTTGSITYNMMFADSVLANNANNRKPVDPANLTDVKIAFFPDSITHSYDFCIKSVVPLMSAPNPVVATGNYGPTWNNQQPQAVNGVNGYTVQSAPFPTNGNPMTMQVSATATGVGFTYTPGGGFQAPNNGPGSFPAVVSGWGPGHDGIQFYGPYKAAKQISALTSIKSSWTFTMGGSGDAVYDLWFGNSATPTVPQVELMIWIGNKDKMPLGSTMGSAFNGRQPYVGTNGTGEKVVSYWVATGTNGSPVTDFDVLAYVKDAASHAYAGLSNSSYLLGVQTGFEVYSGNWTTSNYSINIQ